ncbi:MAG: hypothetical protein EX260_06010 [Desulfobulbaceae bacterium]|nr:MAG: hypothetical protein EX260_06010 [Desulfobulbaceae bacterium]
MKDGKGRALLYTASGKIEKKAYPIAKVEDTVGAGDTFHSAFLASLCRASAIHGPYMDIDPGVLGDAVDFACADTGDIRGLIRRLI